jgi:hypothetical protein
MNNRIPFLIFAIAISCVSIGCSQTNTATLSQTSVTTQANQTADLKWLIYADPKADANLAIEKRDFTLLAFAGRATTFPGIDDESSTLQQQCGYRLLANSSDALHSENELSLRKQLYQYAATFNQLVAVACQKSNEGGTIP